MASIQIQLSLDFQDDFPWRIAGFSAPGTRHVRCGHPCEDSHGWFHTSSGLMVAAASDGAGSAPLARLGSAVAVRAALTNILDAHILSPLDPTTCPAVLAAAFKRT